MTVLEELGYPEAAIRWIPLGDIVDRLVAANHALGNRAADPESFALGYWHGVEDERRRGLRERMERFDGPKE